jgi:PAS domain S-box-containing protein
VPASESNPPQTPAAPAATYWLDWNPQEEFKDLLKLAAAICAVRDGAINLFVEEGKPFKIYMGQSVIEVPLDSWFCSHTIRQHGLFMVPDLREDPRFCDNLFVTGEPYLRFYAGYPLIAKDGYAAGSLCIYDSAPCRLTAIQQEALGVVARQVAAYIEIKRQTIALHATVEELNRLARGLEISDSRFRAFMDASPMAAFIKDEQGRMVYCNRALADRFGAIPEDWIGKTDFEVWPQEVAEKFRKTDLPVLEQNRTFHFEDQTLGPGGRTVTWDVHKYPLVDASGGRSVACAALDVTKEREAEQEVQQVQQELQVANGKLRTLSLTDALTGLMNRRALEDCLERELARCIRSQGAALLVDAGCRPLQELQRLLRTRAGGRDIAQNLSPNPEMDTKRRPGRPLWWRGVPRHSSRHLRNRGCPDREAPMRSGRRSRMGASCHNHQHRRCHPG